MMEKEVARSMLGLNCFLGGIPYYRKTLGERGKAQISEDLCEGVVRRDVRIWCEYQGRIDLRLKRRIYIFRPKRSTLLSSLQRYVFLWLAFGLCIHKEAITVKHVRGEKGSDKEILEKHKLDCQFAASPGMKLELFCSNWLQLGTTRNDTTVAT